MYSNMFHRHLADVAALEAHGVAAPAEYLKLRERFTAYTELANSASDRLAAEVIAPIGADLAEIRALALAEQSATSVDDAAVSEVVRSRVHGKMREIYAPHAGRAYSQVAERFDAAAAAFTKAAKLVDPDSDPATLVKGSQATRDAWFAAPELAARLTEWLGVLSAAARLAGVPPVDDETEIELPLTVDTAKLHKRRVWEAWSVTTGRAGRWGALHRLGATIRAHGKPGRLDPYSPPRPLRQYWVPGALGGGEKLLVDPEDAKPAVPESEWSI